jgi:chromosome segregation ATPase
MINLHDRVYELSELVHAKDRELAQARRERDEANAQADELGRANNEMCDDVTILRERIEKLEVALECFAIPALAVGETHQRLARAAIIGMSPTDPAVDRAWLARQRGRAA